MAAKKDSGKETPLMRQYHEVKAKFADAIVLFRIGDFYETFGEDAKIAAQILGITLTRRANGAATHVELAGFPHHAIDTYLPKLIAAGKRVAICEQMEDPKQAKGIVKRDIAEVITPGTATHGGALDASRAQYLGAIHISGDSAAISLAEITTGEFLAASGSKAEMLLILEQYRPKELLLSRTLARAEAEIFRDYYLYPLDDWLWTISFAEERMMNHFGTTTLKGFALDKLDGATIAAGVTLHYLQENRHGALPHLSSLRLLSTEGFIGLDSFSVRNLELISSIWQEGKTLYDVLNHTLTPMGARLLAKWVQMPLTDLAKIEARHDAVEFLIENENLDGEILSLLRTVGDLERLIGRIGMGKVSPRELGQLSESLHAIFNLEKLRAEAKLPILPLIFPSALADRLASALQQNLPAAVGKGEVFKQGFNAELDEWRTLANGGKDYLLQIQAREVAATGISSLKVGFNNVFGYYLEVTNAHKAKVPPQWIRKQTITSGERYITPELKEYEEKILQAEERIASIEAAMFQELIAEVLPYLPVLQANAAIIASLDCLRSFAVQAIHQHYCRPVMNEGFEIDIKNGRHPVIEQTLPLGQPYIPNDIHLDNQHRQMMIITGPNMSGKSAILRQTALIVLMAQMGSFVPADEVRLGIVDRVFTRVGASDNLAAGESTFMVEMTETASILHNLSSRSLILLDEIGRGTSTYDGISLAWSIVECLSEHPLRPKTLFATHYHELNELETSHATIVNYNVSVMESDGKIIFMRKLALGGSQHSFGIHVAQIAGLPQPILTRAREILCHLEDQRNAISSDAAGIPAKPNYQLKLFSYEDSIGERMKDELKSLNINSLTPLEALIKLTEWKEWIGKAGRSQKKVGQSVASKDE